MKTLTLLTTTLLLALNGCGFSPTPPVQLDDSKATTINQGLLKRDSNNVPLDIYLTSQDWRATLSVHRGRYYLPNNKVIKTFYYAHHAYRIRITGDKRIIRSYKNYFQNNGVRSAICLNPIKRKDRYRVDMVFSHLSTDLNITGCPTGKEMKPATSRVIEI